MREVCGTCKYNKRDYCNKYIADFCCGNEDSEYYGASTEYNDTCEEWEEKE